jgi:hypothetical protein
MEAKTKKIVMVSSIVAAIIIVTTALLIRGKRKKLQKQIASGNADVLVPAKATTPTTSSALNSLLFPIKKGSGTTTAQKNSVRVVQRYINAQMIVNSVFTLAPLKEDGIFGPLTEAALLKVAGVKEVSYSFYNQMESYLKNPPAADTSGVIFSNGGFSSVNNG